MTTTRSTSACSGRCTRAAPASSSRPTSDAILAAVTPRTRLLALSQVLWTTGARSPCASCASRPACRSSSTAPSRSARSRSTRPGSTSLTVSGQKWLCGPTDRRARRRRSGAPAGRTPELLLADRLRADRRFEPPRGRARFDPGWLSSAVLAGLLAAIDVRPDWAFERAADQAAAAASCSRRSSTSSPATRRSSPSGPRIRQGSSTGWRERASSSARSRRPGSFALPAAGGRTRTTCQRLAAAVS